MIELVDAGEPPVAGETGRTPGDVVGVAGLVVLTWGQWVVGEVHGCELDGESTIQDLGAEGKRGVIHIHCADDVEVGG